MRSTTTRTVHFSPDGTLVTRHDRTTLGIVTEKEVDLEAGETATPSHTQDPRPRPPSFQPATYARGEHSGRRSRPSSLTISRLGQPGELNRTSLHPNELTDEYKSLQQPMAYT